MSSKSFPYLTFVGVCFHYSYYSFWRKF